MRGTLTLVATLLAGSSLPAQGTFWPVHDPDPSPFLREPRFADLDADRDLDILDADGGWHENLVGDGLAWAFHDVATILGIPADVDGDHDLDLVASDGWVENELGNGLSWVPAAGWSVPTGPFACPVDWAVADLDLDGDVDIVDGVGKPVIAVLPVCAVGLQWVRQISPTRFETHVILPFDLDGYGAQIVRAGDMDGDGDPDLVVSQAGGSQSIALVENRLHGGGEWGLELIAASHGRALGLQLGDPDVDGDLDVFLKARPNEVRWLQNDGRRGEWPTGAIIEPASGFLLTGGLLVDDMDLNGTSDAIFLNWGGLIGSELYVSLGRENGRVWTKTLVARRASPYDVGDVDGDGDPDLGCTISGGAGMVWMENVISSAEAPAGAQEASR